MIKSKKKMVYGRYRPMPRIFPEKLARLARKRLVSVLLILVFSVLLSAVFLTFPGATNPGGQVAAARAGRNNAAEVRKDTEFPVADWQNAIIRVREKVAFCQSATGNSVSFRTS